MSRLLLHTCCGPCSTYTVKRLRDEGLELAAFWYNPNIHPFMEHQRRLASMQLFAQRVGLPLSIVPGYDMVDFLRRVADHPGDRCGDCYHLRLTRAAEAAREGAYDAFSTTLLISPYQKHGLLREVGEEVGRRADVEFYYEDLRPGFRESRLMTKELGLYRQQYCGCVYSEWERYASVRLGEGFRWA